MKTQVAKATKIHVHPKAMKKNCCKNRVATENIISRAEYPKQGILPKEFYSIILMNNSKIKSSKHSNSLSIYEAGN